MVLHSNLDTTKIKRLTAPPSMPPRFVGEINVVDVSSSGNQYILVATGTSSVSDFKMVGGVDQQFAGDPNGNVTSRCAYDICIDTSTNRLYYAADANSTVWTLLT